MQTPFRVGQVITLTDTDKKVEEYRITGVCGFGASCIVYDAMKGENRQVRIKEYYPLIPACVRTEIWYVQAESAYGEFDAGLERFRNSYNVQSELRLDKRLTNSIIPLEKYCHGYGTEYIVTTDMTGASLDKCPAETLQELLKVLLSTMKVLEVYHEKNLLHLDIKPSNIFRIPETDEHIMMFDFDSISEINSLRNGETMISYSATWAAPEQKQGIFKQLCPATDYYSIGAILFEYLFGRTVSATERSCFYEWNFDEAIKERVNKLNPKIFDKLAVFFAKTLSTNIKRRYTSAEELKRSLYEMIELSDTTIPFIYDNFHYSCHNFIGRKQELQSMYSILNAEDQQVLFINGIGGIGKTELAKRYVYENRRAFEKVIFVHTQATWMDTVLSDSFRLNVELSGKTKKDKYEEKTKLLKELLTDQDIIIIDNMDYEDEKMASIFECSCKFIVTTRLDFSDYNYPQVQVGKMTDSEDLRQLFCAYNSKIYSEDEWNSIFKIIDYVDFHTMTVELVSKYLRNTEISAKRLYGMLQESQCMIEKTSTEIKHRKDKKLKKQSIYAHLKSLFDITKFDDNESEVMCTLSLLNGNIVSQIELVEKLNWPELQAILLKLCRYGWIILEGNDSVRLHQIIQDLVYNEMVHTTTSCPHVSRAIQNAYNTCWEHNVLHSGSIRKDDLYKVMSNHITGEGLEGAKVLAYSENLSKLKEAEQLCIQEGSGERYKVLFYIYAEMIGCIGKGFESRHYPLYFVTDEKVRIKAEKEYISDAINEAKKITAIAEKAIKAIHKGWKRKERIADNYMRLSVLVRRCAEAFVLDWTNSILDLDFSVMFGSFRGKRFKAADILYDYLMELMDKATGFIVKVKDMDSWKIALLDYIRHFYGDDDADSYRYYYYTNFRKFTQYKLILDMYHKKTNNQFNDDECITYGNGKTVYFENQVMYENILRATVKRVLRK